jgi:hypothetical protein
LLSGGGAKLFSNKNDKKAHPLPITTENVNVTIVLLENNLNSTRLAEAKAKNKTIKVKHDTVTD